MKVCFLFSTIEPSAGPEVIVVSGAGVALSANDGVVDVEEVVAHRLDLDAYVGSR